MNFLPWKMFLPDVLLGSWETPDQVSCILFFYSKDYQDHLNKLFNIYKNYYLFYFFSLCYLKDV